MPLFNFGPPDIDRLTTKKDLKGLLKALDYKDYVVRLKVIEALGNFTEPLALGAPIKSLFDESHTVRHKAAYVIARRGRSAIPALLEYLDSIDPASFEYADSVGEAFAKIGELAVEPLMNNLRNSGSYRQSCLAQVLGKMDIAAETLLLAVNDQNENESVRKFAAIALAKLGDNRALEFLLPIFKYEDDRSIFGYAVIEALGKQEDNRAFAALLELLEAAKHEIRRERAATALGTRGDIHAVEPLIRALQEPSSTVRGSVIIALGLLGDVRAVESLTRMLEDESEYVRYHTMVALLRLGDKRIFEPLVLLMQDRNEYRRKNVAEVLGKFGDIRAVEPLLVTLHDQHPMVRAATAEALGNLGDKRALKPLLAARHDKNLRVQECAAEALVKIGNPTVKI